VWRYAWDAENRLTKVKKTNADGSEGVVVEYGYFDNGNRAWKRVTVPGQEPVVTSYVHDGIHVIAEYDGEGELRKEYVYSDNIDEVLNIKDGTENLFPHQDGLNSVVAVTDADGERVASYNYEAFGTIKDATGALGNPITYTGRWIEPETGDYFYRARYYDAGIGRFLKRDPIGFGSREYNYYRYVNNESVNVIDSYGLFSLNIKNITRICNRAVQCVESIKNAIKQNLGTITNDDLAHCYASCSIGLGCNKTFSEFLGFMKEFRDYGGGKITKYLDKITPKKFENALPVLFLKNLLGHDTFEQSVRDFQANIYGHGCISDPKGCKCCCEEKYGKE
jgi:RHS repeat-associated protein